MVRLLAASAYNHDDDTVARPGAERAVKTGP